MKKLKMFTLGSATLDVFLMGKALRAKRDVRTNDFVEQFPLGAKLELDDVVFSTGGGATNAAVTFARAGFDTSFMGKVGEDVAGSEVLKDLEREKVKTHLVAEDDDEITGYSTLLLAPRGERTVLVYRGLSEQLSSRDFTWSKVKGDWLYITSLGGNMKLLEKAVNIAHGQKMKVAVDPGSDELHQHRRLRKLLPKIALIKGNKEEMGRLFKANEPAGIIREAAKTCQYVVVTDGPKGSWASGGQRIYHAGMYKDVKVVDRTGAGDAFGSGLVAKLAERKSMEEALTFGSANSTSVVQHIGSKKGILRKSAKVKKMKITSQPL